MSTNEPDEYGRIIESLVVGRNDNPFRTNSAGVCVPNLERYAVIPLEDYRDVLIAAGRYDTSQHKDFIDRIFSKPQSNEDGK